MLKKIQLFVKENRPEIILFLALVLVSLISFGAGRWSAVFQASGNPIIIEKNGADIGALLEDASSAVAKETPEKLFVGSIKGSKYHKTGCSYANQIKEENRVWFSSEEEAEKAGYQPAGCCNK